MSLVLSKLEYCVCIWDPHFTKDTIKLQWVNRRAAGFVSNDNRWRKVRIPLRYIDAPGARLATARKRAEGYPKSCATQWPSPQMIYLFIEGDSHLRAHHKYKFWEYKTNSDAYKFSFFPRTIIDWDSQDIAEAPSSHSRAGPRLPLDSAHPNLVAYPT